MNTAIIVAAGKSERMGANIDKAFASLGERPVIGWSLRAFEQCPEINQIVLVVRKDQQIAAKSVCRMFGISKIHAVVAGGSRRQDSVRAGLAAVDADTRTVVIHDGARPFVTPELIAAVLKACKRNCASAAAAPIWDTVKSVGRANMVERTEDRTKLWTAQTPQAFPLSMLIRAYKEVEARKLVVTDDTSAVEMIGEQVKLVEWLRPNIKITTPEDLPVAAALISLV